MHDPLLHERLFRGPAALESAASICITVCGAGALGSLLVDSLARQGFKRLTVIDSDRVEAHNVSTQLYSISDAGALKVQVLRSAVFRATGAEIMAISRRLDVKNAGALLREAQIVVDTFDNSASRRAVADHTSRAGLPCLHLGLNGAYGEVRWDDAYTVPQDVTGPDTCDYPLARNLIHLTAAVGAESLVRFVAGGVRESFSITLGDLRISRWAGNG
jgi:molybdopterin/thiamine biosynthesis adenylyltransferase